MSGLRPPAVGRLVPIAAIFEGLVLGLWALEHDTLTIAKTVGATEAQVYNIVARRPVWMRRRRRELFQ